ncbi:protein TolR [Arenimonas composti]|uniref:Tol-Pal system protein TolR n=1 Tax=Arenimonas composti TR7-09 = DSM 18010 TaxID=1121013 RepID=A0A091BK96_9GAMM|nr:protein TolR [Arenimonas composti]KFN51229.1 hypothetical protein P873_02910 [Arenimonas composti TR7-09 = DSM 18010]
MSATITRHRRKRKLKSEINVVPYIDVMLVLLIIFMVTAPLLSLAVDVDLPKANARAAAPQKDPVIVEVDAEGRLGLRLQGAPREEIDAETLRAKLAVFVQANPQVPVFVAGARDAEYAKVMDTMVLLQQAGVGKVALISEPGGNDR